MSDERLIYPPLNAQSTMRLTPGERRVLRMFNRHLPRGWEIYVKPHLNGLRPNFVLLNPEVGIGVFEVSDWDLVSPRLYIDKDRWFNDALWAEKNGEDVCVQSENPITRVNRYRKAIYDLYCPRLEARSGWAAITAGVIFPFADAALIKSLLAPFLKSHGGDQIGRYQPISGHAEITTGNLNAIFPEANRRDSGLMSEDLAQDLRGWLVEPDFSEAQRTPLVLDRDQRPMAEKRTDTGYRRIKGPAGSGKSLVLAARAARLANEGKSVLVATFNVTLWHYLRDLIVRDIDQPKNLNNIEFTHFHLWCKNVCEAVGWEQEYASLWRSYSEEDVLNRALPILAKAAVTESSAPLYDAILVDEGQDYQPLWWNVLRLACKPEGEMLLVADATQDIYGTARAWTDDVMTGAGFAGGKWARLSANYRLAPAALKQARAFAEKFLPENEVDLPQAEQETLDLYPSRLRWIQCLPEEAPAICADEILGLMAVTGAGGLANADITVLADDMKAGAEVVEELAGLGIQSVHTFGDDHRRLKMGFFMNDARVKATTLHSFKGWEARLLVIRVDRANSSEGRALIYAGLTRLKRSQAGSWLTVVCSAPELRDFGTGWSDFVDETRRGPGATKPVGDRVKREIC